MFKLKFEKVHVDYYFENKLNRGKGRSKETICGVFP